MDLTSGTRLGPYEIPASLGAGGMATGARAMVGAALRDSGMRSRSRARRAPSLSVALAFALLAAPGCGRGSGPTGPLQLATPTPQAPSVSVAGAWSGTIAYGGLTPPSEAVSAEIAQAGAQVDAAIEASRFSGRFSGTIRGDQLTGQLTTVIENVPFGAAVVGTVSTSAIHLAASNLHYQNLVMSGDTTIDLSR